MLVLRVGTLGDVAGAEVSEVEIMVQAVQTLSAP